MMGVKKISLFCGERFWSRASWKRYPLFTIRKDHVGIPVGFSIGPILFWDGT